MIVSYEVRQEAEYEIPSNARLLVKDGDHVEPGQPLTEGSLNPHRILRIQGRHACQMYLLFEVQKVYRSQGQNINDKHFEVIIRKMMSKVQVTRPGDTNYLPGDLVDRWRSSASTRTCSPRASARLASWKFCWASPRPP